MQYPCKSGIRGAMALTTIVLELCVRCRELTGRQERAAPRPTNQHDQYTDRKNNEPTYDRASLAANAAHRLALENRAAACSIRQRPSLASAADDRRPRAHPTVAVAHRLAFVGGPTSTVDVGTKTTPAAVRCPATDPFLVGPIVRAAVVLKVLHCHAYRAPPENA